MNGVKALGGTLGKVAGGGVKVFAGMAKAVTATSAGVSALCAAAVNSYADYEQLVGGVETLFGAGGDSIEQYAEKVGKSVDDTRKEYEQLMRAQDEVLTNASVAYKTAGLSTNEYMETITSFAASLKQSCENELEAARAADQAVIDMADNANKMGTSMGDIQNAYQGFAKQNYTMLDNLKLGYGGTKGEMERLLADAQALTGIKYDIDSLSDVYEAIHVIQTELGITGTTAKEASTTISGSLNAMKSAWSNLVTGVADDNQDFDKLVDNFVESVGVAAENMIPRVEVAISGIGKLIEKLFPVMVNSIPGLIDHVLPDLVQSGANIISSLVDGIKNNLPSITKSVLKVGSTIIQTLAGTLPDLIRIGLLLINSFLQEIYKKLPELTNGFGAVISDINSIIMGWLPYIVEFGSAIILNLMEGISQNLPQIMSSVMEIVMLFADTFLNMLPQIIDLGLQVILQLAIGIAEALPTLIPTIVSVLLSIVDVLISNIGLLVDAAIQLMMGLTNGLVNALPILIERLPEIVMSIVNALIENIPVIVQAGGAIIDTLARGILENLPSLLEKVPEIVINVVSALINAAPELLRSALEMITVVGRGLITYLPQLIQKIPQILNSMVNSFFENAPKLLKAALKLITTIADALITYLPQLIAKVPQIINTLKNEFLNLLSGFADVGKNIIDGIWSGISAGWDWLTGKVKGLADSLFEAAKSALGIHSPSRKFKWLAQMCVAGWDEGAEDLMDTRDMTRNINASFSTQKMNAAGAKALQGSSGFGDFNQTINVNQPVSTADELARAVRIESRYGLMRGIALG